jgi:hypothetical protein
VEVRLALIGNMCSNLVWIVNGDGLDLSVQVDPFVLALSGWKPPNFL